MNLTINIARDIIKEIKESGGEFDCIVISSEDIDNITFEGLKVNNIKVFAGLEVRIDDRAPKGAINFVSKKDLIQ